MAVGLPRAVLFLLQVFMSIGVEAEERLKSVQSFNKLICEPKPQHMACQEFGLGSSQEVECGSILSDNYVKGLGQELFAGFTPGDILYKRTSQLSPSVQMRSFLMYPTIACNVL
eukprot:scaffold155637_cov18-Tisochrysis_lutea.AAC.1